MFVHTLTSSSFVPANLRRLRSHTDLAGRLRTLLTKNTCSSRSPLQMTISTEREWYLCLWVLSRFFRGYVGFGDGLAEKGKPKQTSPLSPALEKLLLPSKQNTAVLPALATTWPNANTSHTCSCDRSIKHMLTRRPLGTKEDRESW